MSFPDVNDTLFFDSLQIPTIYDGKSNSYKEWQHFNVFDQKNNLFFMFNFALTGNPFSKKGIATKTVLVKESKGNFVHSVEPNSSQNLKVSYMRPDVSLGDTSIRFKDGKYTVKLHMENIAVSAQLVLTPVSSAIEAYASPFGSGSIGWFAIPRLSATGTISINKKIYKIDNASSYHDHDWGSFQWGEPIGWEWGIFSEPSMSGVTIVLDQRTRGINKEVSDRILGIYKGGKLFRMFTDSEVSITLNKKFSGKKEIAPGIMRVLFPSRSSDVAARIVTQAKMSAKEKISIEFSVKDIVQIIVPNNCGDGNTQINQLFGDLKIKSSVNGLDIKKPLRGYMESVGPI